MGEQDSSNARVSFSVAVVLTWISGVVDVIGFLLFARVYTANMSGNSVALGIALGQANWSSAMFRFWPVLIYVLGLLLGRLFLEIGARLQISRIATAGFFLEAVLLSIAAFIGDKSAGSPDASQKYLAIALLAFAMGVQNAALTRFSSLNLHTGFVTGTLLKCAEELVKLITWIWDTVRAGTPLPDTLQQATRQTPFQLSLFLAITYMAYIFGALLGVFTMGLLHANALALAIAGLTLLMAVDIRDPLAVQDEKQQARIKE